MTEEPPPNEGGADEPNDGDRPPADAGPVRERGGARSPLTDGGDRLSETLDLLASQRRRYVLYYLRDVRFATIDDLAERVATWEQGSTRGAVAGSVRKGVQLDLHHAQLPKLDEPGLVTYNARTGAVHCHDLPELMGEFLDYCAAVERPEWTGH